MTNKTISRYGDRRTIRNNGGGSYTVEGISRYYRVAQNDEGKITMFDFEGGPCIHLGENFPPESPNSIIEEIIVEKSDKKDYAKVTLVVTE